MYFVRSGNIALATGSLRAAGRYGYFWSTTAYPADSRYAFNLYFGSANALPSVSNSRWYGFSLHHLIQTHLYISPMYFVRSGDTDSANGALRSAGYLSYSQSSSAAPLSTQYSFNLSINNASTRPSYSYQHYLAIPLQNSTYHTYAC